jgi:hypothetical protein
LVPRDYGRAATSNPRFKVPWKVSHDGGLQPITSLNFHRCHHSGTRPPPASPYPRSAHSCRLPLEASATFCSESTAYPITSRSRQHQDTTHTYQHNGFAGRRASQCRQQAPGSCFQHNWKRFPGPAPDCTCVPSTQLVEKSWLSSRRACHIIWNKQY